MKCVNILFFFLIFDWKVNDVANIHFFLSLSLFHMKNENNIHFTYPFSSFTKYEIYFTFCFHQFSQTIFLPSYER